MAFDAKYMFKQNNTVVIGHPHGAFIRASPEKSNDADGFGGKGDWAQWAVELYGDNKIQLKNVKTGKYLRIDDSGNDVDVNGVGGKFTIFKVHKVGDEPHIVRLESNEFPGKYIACGENKKVRTGNGGPHCILTFYRDAGGKGGPDQGKPMMAQGQGQGQAQAPAQHEAKQQEKPLNDDAKAVQNWLKTVGYEQYFKIFVDNGYDKLSTVSMVTEGDLEKMGVKAGHCKELMLAARAAPYIGHWLALRSQHKARYLACDQGNESECELDDELNRTDTMWFAEASPNGKNLIRFKTKYDTYLRMPKNQDKHMVTVKGKEIDARCDLQILPSLDAKKQNVVRIWCPNNANFITYDDNILKDRVNSLEEKTDKDWKLKQQWELIVRQ